MSIVKNVSENLAKTVQNNKRKKPYDDCCDNFAFVLMPTEAKRRMKIVDVVHGEFVGDDFLCVLLDDILLSLQ